jgi:hypothetical protein
MTIARLNSNLEVLANFARLKEAEEDSYSVSLLIPTDNRFFVPEESNDYCLRIFYFFKNFITRLMTEGICFFLHQTPDPSFDLRRVVQILSADFEAGFNENLKFFCFSHFLNFKNEKVFEQSIGNSDQVRDLDSEHTMELLPYHKEGWTLETFQDWRAEILSKYPEGTAKAEILSQEIQYQLAMMKAYELFKEVIQSSTLQGALQQESFQDLTIHVQALSSFSAQLQTSLQSPLQVLEECITQHGATFNKVTNTFDGIYEVLCKASADFPRMAIANPVL